ncbi:hypothetical protein [Austwickia chelonae]|uniref:Cell division protein FtsK n=1 Tax=Austwickia chelonae NBRC 105200 TaxID=1184607 RepID=K6W5C1_9MICO|nr:hypothetical protein [Austwickia chelonae]GAB77002.1 hypothetical protein AUCHE_04_00430 [Austwickia chelonae NBRC 105200]
MTSRLGWARAAVGISLAAARRSWRHRRWVTFVVMLSVLGWFFTGDTRPVWLFAMGAWLAPALRSASWAFVSPWSYEQRWAGPWRRLRWRSRVRKRWVPLGVAAGWARPVKRGDRTVHAVPRLRQVRTRDHRLLLVVRACSGQTLEDLEAGAPRLASTLAAVSYRCYPSGAGLDALTIELVMVDVLGTPCEAVGVREPVKPARSGLDLGRTQSGERWLLCLTDRHTLVVSASGAGKGSVL